MDPRCNQVILQSITLARELLALADQGDSLRDDVGCGILFGTIRDSAYKIKSLAESEIAEHKRKDKWSSDMASPPDTSSAWVELQEP